ncbi:MAG: aldo/keto reductase [Brooklawnia sp.]|nr:aldo/keto reductase [Brooklawnia sp.]
MRASWPEQVSTVERDGERTKVAQIPQLRLSDGQQIPQIGFGTWALKGEVATQAVTRALEVGYRHLDMATLYDNEVEIGRALAASAIPRDELFLTGKVFHDDMAPDAARRALETTLADLGVDHLDLYLIHSPSVKRHGDAYIWCWEALQRFQAEGLVTSIGVSNFTDDHIAALRGATPVVNQIELHPTFSQPRLRAQMRARKIAVVSYSPLGQADDLTNQVVQEIAEASGRTPAQVVLRWHVQHGLVAIPRSSHPQRIAENLDIFDFELSREQLGLIDSMDESERS